MTSLLAETPPTRRFAPPSPPAQLRCAGGREKKVRRRSHSQARDRQLVCTGLKLARAADASYPSPASAWGGWPAEGWSGGGVLASPSESWLAETPPHPALRATLPACAAALRWREGEESAAPWLLSRSWPSDWSDCQISGKAHPCRRLRATLHGVVFNISDSGAAASSGAVCQSLCSALPRRTSDFRFSEICGSCIDSPPQAEAAERPSSRNVRADATLRQPSLLFDN